MISKAQETLITLSSYTNFVSLFEMGAATSVPNLS